MRRATPEQTTPTGAAAILVAEAIRESGLTQADIAAAVERKPQRISEMARVEHTRTMSLRDVVQAPPAFRRALVALLAAMDGDRVVPEEQATDRLDDVAAIGELTRRLGAILGEESAAQRDSLYDRQEAASLREAYADVVQLGMERIARLEQAEAAGVDAVRGPLQVAK